MPAEGGHARNLAQRQANARSRGQRPPGTGGAGNWNKRHRNTSQIQQGGGLTVSSASYLKQRAHRPGWSAGTGGSNLQRALSGLGHKMNDPRYAVAGQQWGAGTGQRAYNPTVGFQEGGRWWERDTGVRMSTDITQTAASRGSGWVNPDDPWTAQDSGRVGEDWLRMREARWGKGAGDLWGLGDLQLFNDASEANAFADHWAQQAVSQGGDLF